MKKFEKFLQSLPAETFPANTHIYTRWKKVEKRYIVVEGIVAIVSYDKLGVEKRIMGVMKGEVIPSGSMTEIPRFADYEYVAYTDCVLAEFTDKNLQQLISDPELVMEKMKIQDLRTRQANLRIETLMQGKAEDKLMYLFLYMAERIGQATPAKEVVLVDTKMSQTDIGNSLGLTRETTAKVVNKLTKAKMIMPAGKGHYMVHKRLLVKAVCDRDC